MHQSAPNGGFAHENFTNRFVVDEALDFGPAPNSRCNLLRKPALFVDPIKNGACETAQMRRRIAGAVKRPSSLAKSAF